MIDHTCSRCGEPLNPVNWFSASIGNRFESRTYKLCDECAALVDSTMRSMMGCDGYVRKAVKR